MQALSDALASFWHIWSFNLVLDVGRYVIAAARHGADPETVLELRAWPAQDPGESQPRAPMSAAKS